MGVPLPLIYEIPTGGRKVNILKPTSDFSAQLFMSNLCNPSPGHLPWYLRDHNITDKTWLCKNRISIMGAYRCFPVPLYFQFVPVFPKKFPIPMFPKPYISPSRSFPNLYHFTHRRYQGHITSERVALQWRMHFTNWPPLDRPLCMRRSSTSMFF